MKKSISQYIPIPEKTILVQASIPKSLHKSAYKIKEKCNMEWDEFIIGLLRYVVENDKDMKKVKTA